MKKTGKAGKRGGYAMIIAVVFFLFFSSLIAFSITAPVVARIKIANDFLLTRQSLFLSEAGVEDMTYRIANGKTYANSETLALGGSTTTISVSSVSGGVQVASSGNVASRIQNMQATLASGGGVGFNYGIQTGNGGFVLNGGSTINGNIYSNASINAVSATINGTAVAADSPALLADQTNDSPATPPSSANFRNAAATQDFAQSFQVSSKSPLNYAQFYIKKTGSPANATVIIAPDNGGSPANQTLSSVTLAASAISTSFGWVQVSFPTSTPLTLIPGATYWLVIQNGSTSGSSYYTIGTNTTYANGAGMTGKYGGSWTALGADGYFRLYTGGIHSYIGGASYDGGLTIGTGGVGDAWAYDVEGTKIDGNLYCIIGSHNTSKTCDTSRGIPPSVSMPFTDANLQSWKDAAVAGGTLGSTTVGSSNATLGPAKINGNLLVNGGGTLTLNGPLWVTGTVTITNGGKVQLPSNYGKNSETIIADGIITISGGGSLGSGAAGSFLFVVSTSRCPNDINCGGSSAINVTGGAGAIAATAQSGNVALSGGAVIDAIVGNSVSAVGGTTVNYNSGLASPSFKSGPSGGYSINSWAQN